MKNTDEPLIINVAKWTAIVSFCVGVLITLLYMATHDSALLPAGLIYIMIAFCVNILVLLILILSLITHNDYWRKTSFAICLLLVNIPVCIGCIYLSDL